MYDVLDQVDGVIRALLLRELKDVLTSSGQVGFDPPDDHWRTAVANLGHAVNVYLVDVRENRSLRDPEWLVEFNQGVATRSPAPLRVDCHYLISAWSAAAAQAGVEPTRDEHALLYRVMAALAIANPLNPSRVYPPGSVDLADVDALIRDADLPVNIVPAEGWPKLTEFWGTMGANSRAKPAICYTVTVPVAMPHHVAGPLVTTRIIEFRQDGDPATAEQWLQVGGTVTDAAGKPVDGAVVTVSGSVGQVIGAVKTTADGRFSVGGLHADGYAIHAAKPSVGTADTTAALPGRSGDYDLTLT
jgi:hypothetical protein